MSYFMNKVKYFAYQQMYIPSQKMVSQRRANTHIFKLGLTGKYKFFMNNPDFETLQYTTIMV